MQFSSGCVVVCMVVTSVLAASEGGVGGGGGGGGAGVDCTNDPSLGCHGIKIVKRVVRQVLENQSKDVQLTDGVHLVEAPSAEARSVDDGSFYGTVEKYLMNHELRIKLPDIIPPEGIKSTLKNVIDEFSERSMETARRKNRGNSAIMIMAVMMGKVLAAVGFGSIGLLAMKALMVSALALMLSAILGIKKLASSGQDSAPQVIYAGGHGDHGHRRRRDASLADVLPLPYRGWAEYFIQE